jgi:glycerol-3-phosphate dehydrogenase (NAD(P)+)
MNSHLRLKNQRGFSREVLNKLIPLMVRQAHHERNQYVTVHPELVEGFNQRFPSRMKNFGKQNASGIRHVLGKVYGNFM